ncbi:MAG TPA: EthD family reductase [Hyphomicrobiaceae bacterium]|nr:EthD family reductase [Hyphomicrobiaceae bacterium]
MVRVTVLYPNEPGKRFDHGYYANKHLPMVMERLKSSGMLRYEVDKGLAGGGPGAPAPFVAACHLYFNAVADFQNGIGAHSTEIMGDIPNYTDISPQIQISEIVVS